MIMNRLRSQVGVSVLLACALGVYSSGSGGNVQVKSDQHKKKVTNQLVNTITDSEIKNRDKIAAVKKYIAQGADVDGTNYEGRTALQLCLRRGFVEIAQILLSAGANPNIGSAGYNLGTLVVSSISISSKISLLTELCRRGLDINARSGFSAIYDCTLYNNFSRSYTSQMIKALFEHGLSKESLEERTTSKRYKRRDRTAREYLASGSTVLHVAARQGNATALNEICVHGADVNVTNDDGNTALHEASMPMVAYNKRHTTSAHKSANLEEIVELLLKSMNHDLVDHENNEGKTALHVAAEHNRTAFVRSLLNVGADINNQDSNSWTPLHHAAFNNHIGVVEELCEHGANIHLQNAKGETPLHLARDKDHRDVVAFLSDYEEKQGAALPPEYNEIASAPQLVKGSEVSDSAQTEIEQRDAEIALLREKLAKRDKAIAFTQLLPQSVVETKTEKNQLLEAVLFGDNDQTTALLNTGTFTADARDERSYTLLHIAAEQGNSELCNTLLFHGAPVNAMVHEGARRGWTPLHFAVARKNHELVQIFLNVSAFPSIPDSKGDTPLHWAVSRQDAQITSLLLEAGGRPDTRNAKGKTPLSIASEKNNSELIALLEGYMPEAEEQGVRCCICQDSLDQQEDQSFVVARECGHVIHTACSQDVIDCPVCREALGPDSWQRLYFEV